MKNLLVATCFLAVSLSSPAQCINGVLSYPIYKEGAELVKDFDDASQEIVRIEYDLVFTSKISYRDLFDDWEYTIIGFADAGVKDLDLKLYVFDDLLEDWTLVAEDDTEGPEAQIVIAPEYDASYAVEVIVYEFNEGFTAARYGLMYVHD